MSRIGKKIINIPEGVEIDFQGRTLTVKGPKGFLSCEIHPRINLIRQEHHLQVQRTGNDKFSRSLHGTMRNLIANQVHGVTEGYTKQLELKGVGYRAQTDGHELTLSVGFSHPVVFQAPEGIEFKVDKNTLITVLGIDKQAVGEIAAQIRVTRPPEPYKGKGIRYVGETVRRKLGKATKAIRA